MSVLTLIDRVLEVVTGITGTGMMTLAGAVSGYQSFAAIGNGNTCYYYAEAVDANGIPNGGWEVGLGTYNSASTGSLTRTTVIASSNSGSAVSWSSANLRVGVIDVPAALHQYPIVETAITGTTTLTAAAWGKAYLVSGTSANFTVTLPTAVGHAGETIRFRMAAIGALSKLIALDGNSTETIDGSLTRVMWAGETCTLLSDGANLTKIDGRSVPMVCAMHINAAQSIANNTVTKIALDTTDQDNTGVMADAATNHLMTIARPNSYQFSCAVGFLALSTNVILARLGKNGSTAINVALGQSSGAAMSVQGAGLLTGLVATDTIELDCYQNSGGAIGLIVGTLASNNVPYLCLTEVLSW